MKTLILKNVIYLTVLIGLITPKLAQSQPAEFARERIETLKMVKLLEILDLNEDESNKFIVKYKTMEKSIKEKADKIDILEDELKLALKKDASDKEIKELSDKLVNTQNDFFSATMEKVKSMQSILSQKNYAKFLIFEKNFHKKLRNMLMDKSKKNGNPNFDDDDGPPMRPRKQR